MLYFSLLPFQEVNDEVTSGVLLGTELAKETDQDISRDMAGEMNGNKSLVMVKENDGERKSHPGKVVVGKEVVGWGQTLRVTLHTTTK